jgi:hypothetical protein
MEQISENFMKHTLTLCIVCLALASCGKRGPLEPGEGEEVPYPRQYPAAPAAMKSEGIYINCYHPSLAKLAFL